MVILFIWLFISCLLGFVGYYTPSKISFAIFLLVLTFNFIYHISDKLTIQL